MVKALPNTSFLPVSKSAPAGHATAAAHLLWQVFPRYPCLEYKDNSGQSCPVRYTWTASFGRGLMFWQKRFNLTPQFVAYQFPGHLLHPHWYFTAYSSICQVLLGALNGDDALPKGTHFIAHPLLTAAPPAKRKPQCRFHIIGAHIPHGRCALVCIGIINGILVHRQAI